MTSELAAVFFGLAYGIMLCFRRGYVELGTALSMTAVVYLWRVIQWDANRLLEQTDREFRPRPEPEIRHRPVTIEQTSPGTYVYKYGQLDATEDLDFCERALGQGYKTFIHRDIRCGHLKEVDMDRIREMMEIAYKYALEDNKDAA